MNQKVSKPIPPPKSARLNDDERRKSIRHLSHKRLKAKIKAKDESLAFEKDIEANVLDLSLTGFGFCTSIHIPAGFEITFEITTPKQSYTFDGRVIWSGALPRSGHVVKDSKDNDMAWQIGVDLHLSNDEKKKLIEALYSETVE